MGTARVFLTLQLAMLLVSLQASPSMGEQWIEGFKGDTLWNNAITSGKQQNVDQPNYDSNKRDVYYVGRAYSSEGLSPCKIEFDAKADVAWCVDGKGNEFSSDVYEVLTAEADKITWYPAANGDVPAEAQPTGITTTTGEPLYSCRVMDQAHFGLLSGTLLPSSKQCKINYFGVKSYSIYEVLVILK